MANETALLVVTIVLSIISLANADLNTTSSSFDNAVQVMLGLNWTHGVRLVSPNMGDLAKLAKSASLNGLMVIANDFGLNDNSKHLGQVLPMTFYLPNVDQQGIEDFIKVMHYGIYATEGLMLLTSGPLASTAKARLIISAYREPSFTMTSAANLKTSDF